MKTARRSPPAAAPGRPAAPPRRARRPYPRPARELPFRSAEQRRWFGAEVAAFSRHVHTARLAGDFVAAQRLERELTSFTEATRQLLGSGETYEATYNDEATYDNETASNDELVCGAKTESAGVQTT